MKKIVSNYNEVIFNFKTYYITYKKTYRNFSFWLKHRKKEQYPFTDEQNILIEKIKNKKSILIDSFGYLFVKNNENVICFENERYKKIFDKIPNFDKKVYTTDNFFSNTMLQIIKKESPNYLVFFNYTDILRYKSVEDLAEFINYVKKEFKNINLLFFIDMIFIDFNKIKYSNNDVIEILKNKVNLVFSYKKISELNYFIEIT